MCFIRPIRQKNDRSCTLASMTMVVNAARVNQKLTADDEIITQQSFLEYTGITQWAAYTDDAETGPHGVALDNLGSFALEALRAYGFKNATVEIVHSDGSETATRKIKQMLIQNEKSADDFMMANFLQGDLTGDPEGSSGHVAPIGAYDLMTDQVLILDPFRKYYEPYWSKFSTFIKAMTSKDGSTYRGIVFVHLNSR